MAPAVNTGRTYSLSHMQCRVSNQPKHDVSRVQEEARVPGEEYLVPEYLAHMRQTCKLQLKMALRPTEN